MTCKKMVEFKPSKKKKLKNGLTAYIGKDEYSHKVSVIGK